MSRELTQVADTKFELCHDVARVLKIGRDFQKQDTWRGAHHDTAKLLCDTIEYLRDSLNTPIGNAAAMYTALKEMQARLVAGVQDGTMDCYKALEIVEKAIAEPPRNCDLFGGDPKMLRTAWFDWSGSPSGRNPDGTVKLTFGEWLLATAPKEGAE